jgi:hypothetical protein
MKKIIAAMFLIAAFASLLNSPRAPMALAAPPAQSPPAPTDEPLKSPYVFPTPVFIPTFSSFATPPSIITPRATSIAPLTPGLETGDTYTVQSGDSPWTIAIKFYGDGTKFPLIMEANGLTVGTRLRVGTVLQIPPLPGSTRAAPTLAAPSAATAIPPTPPLSPPPTARATTAPTLAPTPAPSGFDIVSVADAATLALNVIAAILALAAFGFALLSFLVYIRSRRMIEFNTITKRLRFRQ